MLVIKSNNVRFKNKELARHAYGVSFPLDNQARLSLLNKTKQACKAFRWPTSSDFKVGRAHFSSHSNKVVTGVSLLVCFAKSFLH